MMPPVIASGSEAIQFRAGLDCRASLAMTFPIVAASLYANASHSQRVIHMRLYGFKAALIGLTLAMLPAPLLAQANVQPPPSAVPVPNELELAKLVWSTMAAVDHGNISGNYSVLRDMSAPGFQANNDAARLAQIFASLRASNTDLSNTLLLAPTYRAPPRLEAPGLLRVQGMFGLRPTAINFDLYFQWLNGRWRLFGVAIAPSTIATQEPPRPPVPAKVR